MNHFCTKPTEQCLGRAPGGVGMEVRSAAFQDKEKSITVLELMAPLASRKVFGLRNNFRVLLHRSGRKLALVLVCGTIPDHPTLPWLLQEGKSCGSVRGLCALPHCRVLCQKCAGDKPSYCTCCLYTPNCSLLL